MNQESLPSQPRYRHFIETLKQRWLADQSAPDAEQTAQLRQPIFGQEQRPHRPYVNIELPSWLEDDPAAEAPIAPVEDR